MGWSVNSLFVQEMSQKMLLIGLVNCIFPWAFIGRNTVIFINVSIIASNSRNMSELAGNSWNVSEVAGNSWNEFEIAGKS